MTTAVHNHDDKLIGRWLTVCTVTISGMILSELPALRVRSPMVDWRPIRGDAALID